MSEKQSALEPGAVLTYEVDDNQTLSEGVVAAVAAVSNTDPAEMDPLAEAIDPDALDALFADHYDGTPRSTGTAQFSFFDHELVVSGDGHVSVVEAPR
jgi:hypothetical protein